MCINPEGDFVLTVKSHSCQAVEQEWFVVAESFCSELNRFLASCLQGFPPMSKYGLQMVMKLASCYGLKASAQGSGKKQFVVVGSLHGAFDYSAACRRRLYVHNFGLQLAFAIQ